MVFQNYALYPHMTVYKNIAFGLIQQKVPKDEIRQRVTQAAEMLGITSLLDRRPAALSGGKLFFYFLLGIVTGAVCAASGAGGPVLVMPLLTLLGFPAHTAVGMSLFNSIFIALPAAAGYLWHGADNREMFLLLVPVLLAHGIGVAVGSKNATKINQTALKRIVAVGSIAIALVKLFL